MVIDPAPTNKILLSVDEWLQFNNVTVKPREVVYPAPEFCTTFEKIVLMYSSERPLWSHSWDSQETDEERLRVACDDMSNYARRLAEKSGDIDETEIFRLFN